MGRVAALPPLLDPAKVEPGIIEDIDSSDTGTSGGWIVTVFNNEHNTYEEVIDILRRATSCSFEEAHTETWEIDHLGLSVVHHGSETECNRAAEIIATIGIDVKVSEE